MKYDFSSLTEEETDTLYFVLVAYMDCLSSELEEDLDDIKEEQVLFSELVEIHNKIKIKEVEEECNEN